MKFLIALLTLFSFSLGALTTGEKAPDFTLTGVSKKEITLSDYKGKYVILEWLNHGCPFVKKHYNSGNMQSLQKKFLSQDVIWLSIISSAPGKQGHGTAEEVLKEKEKNNSQARDILLDPSGKVGKLYGAKTTPHMYIIDKNGNLVYQGAIDDKPDTDLNSIKSAKNYVDFAMNELLEGRPVTAHTTRAYGCSVKY